MLVAVVLVWAPAEEIACTALGHQRQLDSAVLRFLTERLPEEHEFSRRQALEREDLEELL